MGWLIDHAETISDKNIEPIKKLGGIAVQHRMAFQGEYFAARYGAAQMKRTPPIKRMLELGVPVGAGTDATRVASYNSFVSLYWLVSGTTVGGMSMYTESNRLSRREALRLWTVGSNWFLGDAGKKGSIEVGRLADLAVLSDDFFTAPEVQIRSLESVLTILDGSGSNRARRRNPALSVSGEKAGITGRHYRMFDDFLQLILHLMSAAISIIPRCSASGPCFGTK